MRAIFSASLLLSLTLVIVSCSRLDMTDSDNAESGEHNEAKPATKSKSETSYPYFGLDRAIEIVRAVRRAGGKEAPNSEVLKELGLSKVTDRIWAYGVPAAKYFGVVEGIGRGQEGRLKVTDLGLRIVAPTTEDEARVARVAAFQKPELYLKLQERFAGVSLPSAEGLGNLLHRDYGIVESMSRNAAEAFIESLKIAELITAAGSVIGGAVSGATSSVDDTATKAPPVPIETRDQPATQQFAVPQNYVIHTLQLRKELTIRLPLPPDLSMKDVGRIHNWLKTVPFDDESETGGTGK